MSNSRAAAAQILGSIDTARVDPFAGLSKYSNELDARARADAEQAQRDILFKQQQDDRTRLMSERTAGDIINRTMQEPARDRSGWLTDLAKNADINSIVLKGDATTGYTDESGKAITNPAEIARRVAMQESLGEFAGNSSQQETEVDRLTRAIGLANTETGVTPEKSRTELQQARAAELEANRERLKSTETQIAGLRKDASDKNLELAKDLFKVNPGYSTTTVTEGGNSSSGSVGVSKEPFPKMTLSTIHDFEQKAKDKVSWSNMTPDPKAIAEAIQYGKDNKIPEIITMNAINNLTKLEFSGNTIPSANVIIETMKSEKEFFDTKKAEYDARQKARDVSDSGPRTSTTTYSPASNPNEIEYRKLVNSTVGDIETKKAELEKSLTRLKMSPKERQDAEGRDLIDTLFRGSKQLPNEVSAVPVTVGKDTIPTPGTISTEPLSQKTALKGSSIKTSTNIGDVNTTKPIVTKPLLTRDEIIAKDKSIMKKDTLYGGVGGLNKITEGNGTSSIAGTIADFVAPGASGYNNAQALDQKTHLKTYNYLTNGGIINPRDTNAKQVGDLQKYITSTKDLSDDSKEVLDAMVYSMKLKDPEFRKKSDSDQRTAAGWGVVNAATAPLQTTKNVLTEGLIKPVGGLVRKYLPSIGKESRDALVRTAKSKNHYGDTLEVSKGRVPFKGFTETRNSVVGDLTDSPALRGVLGRWKMTPEDLVTPIKQFKNPVPKNLQRISEADKAKSDVEITARVAKESKRLKKMLDPTNGINPAKTYNRLDAKGKSTEAYRLLRDRMLYPEKYPDSVGMTQLIANNKELVKYITKQRQP